MSERIYITEALAAAADAAFATGEAVTYYCESTPVLLVPDTKVVEFAANGNDPPPNARCVCRDDGRKIYVFRHPDSDGGGRHE